MRKSGTGENRASKRSEQVNQFLLNVGARIREARLRKQWSQSELAEKLGLHPNAISTYEVGATELPIGRLCELAVVLNVEPTWLIEKRTTAVSAAVNARLEYLFPRGSLTIIEQAHGWTTANVLIQPGDTETLKTIMDALQPMIRVIVAGDLSGPIRFKRYKLDGKDKDDDTGDDPTIEEPDFYTDLERDAGE